MAVILQFVCAALGLAFGGMMLTPDTSKMINTVQFPHLASRDLAGRSLTLPAELPGERTVLLIAFTREQQTAIDGWVSGLKLDNGDLPWLELPVIEKPGAITRWFIDSGMRRGISNHDTWKHVVTLYTNKKDFKAAVGITDESVVYAMVVDRQGKILVSVPGPFTPQSATLLLTQVNDTTTVTIK